MAGAKPPVIFYIWPLKGMCWCGQLGTSLDTRNEDVARLGMESVFRLGSGHSQLASTQ